MRKEGYITKRKEYFMVFTRETDGDPEIGLFCSQTVREMIEKLGLDQEEVAIFSGDIIKGFGAKMDLSKL